MAIYKIKRKMEKLILVVLFITTCYSFGCNTSKVRLNEQSVVFIKKQNHMSDEHYTKIEPESKNDLEELLYESFDPKSFYEIILYDKQEYKNISLILNNTIELRDTISSALEFLLSTKSVSANTLKYKPKWKLLDSTDLLSSYYIISTKKEQQLFYKLYDLEKVKHKDICIIYKGANHLRNSSIKKKPTADNLIQTSHGVLINHDSLYSWCFISQISLTPFVEKLRWPSIKNSWFFPDDQIVIVEQQNVLSNENFIYLVQYSKGRIDKIHAMTDSHIESIKLVDGRIELVSLSEENSRKEIKHFIIKNYQ